MFFKIKKIANIVSVFIKQNKVLSLTAFFGVLFVLLIILFSCGVGKDWWEVFGWGISFLGYVADLAIVGVFIKYITSETLTIRGIGKFKIRRMQNNIQDLTNLISWKLYDGDNFKRNTLLEAFYKDTSMEIIERDPEYTKYKDSRSKSTDSTVNPPQEVNSVMLINLSNHPYDTWSDAQKGAAEKFGKCIDIPFPNIPSDADEAEIDKLVNQHIDKIKEFKTELPDDSTLTVHIMGEQTFCYSLINKLQKAGIPCVASCTTRDVTVLPDGSKQVRFHFSRFRGYN